jgi:hypothetical protein
LNALEQKIIVRVANASDVTYAHTITDEMQSSAKARGTGIAKRTPEWGHETFVANSGLIVAPAHRKSGVAKLIKQTIFQLSRERYPTAKIFGLTTGLAVMKINSDLGYEPVTYSELTDDEEFWAGCKSCVNYEILLSKDRKNCMCTAMLYDPADHYTTQETSSAFKSNSKLYERFMKFKHNHLMQWFRKKEKKTSKL